MSLRLLLKKAHDTLDDANASSRKKTASCRWCNGKGYDFYGLIHKPNCVLVEIREVLGDCEHEWCTPVKVFASSKDGSFSWEISRPPIGNQVFCRYCGIQTITE